MRILVVEDEVAIAQEVCEALRQSNYVVEWSRDGADGWFRAETEEFDAIILDLGLPRLDGLTVLRRVRAAGLHLPIVVLTARGNWTERVEGIDAGADDYLPKPFQMEELLSRLSAVIRRAAGHSSSTIEIGSLRLELRRQAATLEGRGVNLSTLEFRLLRYLMHNRGRVVGQSELAEHVYESDRAPDNNALEALMARLRRKIGSDVVTTRRGQGYIVEA